ncbi:MAG: hypothetical protein SFV23_13005 [Planctomycetaceae bacterium]|nr:hypothetical protein [Planctomycetaceae bacterium]
MSIQFPMLMNGVAVALALCLATARIATAGDDGCDHCGCASACHRICRLVAQDRKITTTCWGYSSEEFCDPGPSTRGCEHCETVCDECHAPKAPFVLPKRLVWTDWCAGGTNGSYTKKKLMKKTVTKTVPGYKWVVEDLCPTCEEACQNAAVAPGAQVPPAPVIADVKVISDKASGGTAARK